MKVKRCYLHLVSCFVLGFCLIFLNTLHVNAASGYGGTNTYSISFDLFPNNSTVDVRYTSSSFDLDGTLKVPQVNYSETGYWSTSQGVTTVNNYGGHENAHNDTIDTSGTMTLYDQVQTYGYFSVDLEIPIRIDLASYSDVDYSRYFYVSTSNEKILSSSSGSVTYEGIFYNGKLLSDRQYDTFSKLYHGSQASGSYYINAILKIHVSDVAIDVSSPKGYIVNFQCYHWIGGVTETVFRDNTSTFVSDPDTQSLIQSGNELQTQGNSLQQQNNTISQDTNNKITSFFGSFFDNLIGVFVPESGFFSQWFSDLNTFMSQKLGFLWSPFDFVISFLNGIYSSSGGASPGIVFPGLTWIDGTVIIPQQTFTFDNIGGESFSDLRDMIYFATDVILLGAVVHQFYQKIKIVFEGGSD